MWKIQVLRLPQASCVTLGKSLSSCRPPVSIAVLPHGYVAGGGGKFHNVLIAYRLAERCNVKKYCSAAAVIGNQYAFLLMRHGAGGLEKLSRIFHENVFWRAFISKSVSKVGKSIKAIYTIRYHPARGNAHLYPPKLWLPVTLLYPENGYKYKCP